ncbi:MAG: beta-mannanase [Synergistaceae bacterium]|jgi:hypothetical protein|nr:beta-mannanase [Synergistaceae bacterium]
MTGAARVSVFVFLITALMPFRALAGVRLAPPASGVYHSAHPDFGPRDDRVTPESVRSYVSLAGKKIVWAYVSWHWNGGIVFPARSCRVLHEEGVVPLVGAMPWSGLEQGKPEPVYTLERIVGGDFDGELARCADDVRDLGFPVMIEFGPEANGSWFPWSGAWNGRGGDEYGESGVPDGPERFREAYRRIVRIFRDRGARDVTWVFHVASNGSPKEEWNSASSYYPGDEWVDWIGASVYGRLGGSGDAVPFEAAMRHLYPGLCALSPSKPIAILELGVSEGPDTAVWIADALRGVSEGRYPRVKAVSWWNKTHRPDGSRSTLEIDSSPSSLEAYREGVKNFMEEAVWDDDKMRGQGEK